MGLGQSKQYRANREPRYPLGFQPYQPPPQFIPAYMPATYAQPMYPQPGFIPPIYGQGAVPPQQLHYFVDERQRKRKTRRPTRTETFIPVRDEPSSVERNRTHRAPTPFIPRLAEAEVEAEEEEDAVRPSGPKPRTPLRNPLPPPPKDLYEMSPYKSLLTLPQTAALLTAYGSQQHTVTVTPVAANETMKRKTSIFRAFSKKDKKPQPEQRNPVFIPVFLPASSQPQQPSNQPQHSSIRRSSTQPRQSEARAQTRQGFQSQRRPFAGAGPRDTPTPTTAEPTTADLPTGGTYQSQDDSSSVSDVLSLPIPPHPTNPPTIKFDQNTSYPQFMNHSPHRVIWNGQQYPTALHLHEALKFLDHRPDIAELIRQCANIHEVYPLSAKYVEFQRPDWGDQFLPLMEEVLYSKFRQHPDLRIMLLGTGTADLEYASPVDEYWGSGADGRGANQLGKVLTEVREQLREDSTP